MLRRFAVFRPRVFDFDGVVFAHGEDQVGDPEGAVYRVFRIVDEKGNDLVVCLQPQRFRDGARRYRIYDDFLLYAAVSGRGVVNIFRVLRRDRNAQRDLVCAGGAAVSVVVIMQDIFHRAFHDFEWNGIVDVLIFRIARVGDADEFSVCIEQPAARIAFIKRGIDAQGTVGAGRTVDVERDLFVFGADHALCDAQPIALGVADGDRRFAHMIIACKSDRLGVGVDRRNVFRFGAQHGDVGGD